MASSDSPASEPCATESVVDVNALLIQGQQSVKSGDITAAIDKFKEACSALESQFGEGAAQVAEAYLLYGQALLLKSCGDRPAFPETKSVASDAAAPGGDALAAGDTAAEDAKDRNADTAASAAALDLASGDPDAAAVNVQLAEKALGYAKDAFSTGDESETKVKYSNALLGLAKCSFEKKAYDVSIAFLEQSCEVQNALSAAKSEVLLETYYLLGVCYNAVKNQVDALKALNLGKSVASDILAEGESAPENPCKSAAVAEFLKKIEAKIDVIQAEQGGIPDSVKASDEVSSEPAPADAPASSTDDVSSDVKDISDETAVADAVPVAESEELKSDAACVEEPITESADAVATAVHANGTCNKRPLLEEDHENVKKAKHEVDGSENGENDVDGSAAANADGCCEEPCSA